MARPNPLYALSVDWETSGFTGTDYGGSYAAKHQGIAIGAAVVRLSDLEIVDTLYYEIKFDETKYVWDDYAEKIHGLSREHLAQNGVDPETVATALGNLIVKYWASLDNPVSWIGHNKNFDIDFTRQLMEPFGIMFPIDNRQCDTAAVAFSVFGVWSSNELYDKVGLPPREAHNALEDCIYSVEVLKRIRTIFDYALESVSTQSDES